MKAIRVEQTGAPEVMQWQETGMLTAGDQQVLIRVKAAGVNPVDTYIRAGTQGYSPVLPYTPGLDAAGLIEGIGPGVRDLEVGDRVYISGSLTGAYAEYVLCKATQVHRLPDSLSFSEGAAIFVAYTTAYRALFQRGGARAGDRILVHGGSGAVGIAAVQLARAAGMNVIASASSQQGRDLAALHGAMIVVDHSDETHFERIIELTRQQGVNVIVEMMADINLKRDLEILSAGGTVVVVGNRGTVEINPRELMKRDAQVCGMSLMNMSEAEVSSVQKSLHAQFQHGYLKPVIRQEFHMSEAAAAHEAVMQPGAIGKIVLVP